MCEDISHMQKIIIIISNTLNLKVLVRTHF